MGHVQTTETSRSGVHRLLEQAVAEGFANRRLRIADDTGEQAGDTLDDGKSRHLAASEHEVTQRDLLVGEVVGHPLVDPLVSSTDQGEVLHGRPPVEIRLGESISGGGEDDTMARIDRLQGRHDGFDPHHHAGSTSEGSVVHLAMYPPTMPTNVLDVDREDPGLGGAIHHRHRQRLEEHCGEDGEDGYQHFQEGSGGHPKMRCAV